MSDKKLKKIYAPDQYGRYAIIKEIIETNKNNTKKIKILDVGGRGNILKKFLPDEEVFYLDPFVESNDKNFIKGDGTNISLDDNSFDWVVSADVYEHIPTEKRLNFINENLRVAKKGVVLVAPFYSKENEAAEIRVNNNYKILSGEEHPWLKEHIENGLPDPDELERYLSKNNIKYQKTFNNYLGYWEYLMNLSCLVSHNYSEDIKEKFEELSVYYNTEIFPIDRNQKSYRTIYVISKDNQAIKIPAILDKRTIDTSFQAILDKGFVISNLINNNMRQYIDGMEKIFMSEKEDEIEKLEKKNQELNEKIRHMESSKFWKLQRIYSKIKPSALSNSLRKSQEIIKKDGLWSFLTKSGYYLYFMGSIPNNYINYKKWIKNNENWNLKSIKKEIQQFKNKPKFSVITPVYNVHPDWLNKCIKSVQNQLYENWELCLYDDASTNPETIACLSNWEGRDPRIKIKFGKNNKHISGASNEALRMATGDFVVLLDNDDELSREALFEGARALNNNSSLDFIYSDEDKISKSGRRFDPFFKPDWSPELMLSQMYTCHLGFYRRSLVKKIGGFRKGFEGAQDYDLVLRFIEKTEENKIYHIPRVLYHWRTLETSTALMHTAKNYAYMAAKKAINEHLERTGEKGTVLDSVSPGNYRVKFEIIGNPLVSIIIPFRDQSEILEKCVNSILTKTKYQNFEILLVDNQSEKKETKDYLQRINKDKRVKILCYNKPFSYSAINNFAVKKAKGEYVVLLNNDTEVISREWLTAMLEYAQRARIGIVGAKLIYPNGRIQHAGVIMGMGIAGHAFKGYWDGDPNYFQHADIIKNYSAVTAACLMTKKTIYEKVNGLDEINLKVAYNDVDYCLKVIEAGYRVVYTPYAKLYHYESYSRGDDEAFKTENPEEYKRVLSEREYMSKKWEKYIERDPFYSPNLTKEHEDFTINTKKIDV